MVGRAWTWVEGRRGRKQYVGDERALVDLWEGPMLLRHLPLHTHRIAGAARHDMLQGHEKNKTYPRSPTGQNKRGGGEKTRTPHLAAHVHKTQTNKTTTGRHY
ncbi:hypothetical protein NHX12_033521 [Muraenolepis orangiensis]|uniref:Uncharacterized protein n=1 Tax=Muraenolepis orangiensis TaxID=630683 RepID=A0A9Q0IGD1_9TELE|nr:hypothetical protein NHX12_033521 [Muraenolepis orangiensis]